MTVTLLSGAMRTNGVKRWPSPAAWADFRPVLAKAAPTSRPTPTPPLALRKDRRDGWAAAIAFRGCSR